MKLPWLSQIISAIGLDLGSDTIRIWTPKEGVVLEEPARIAIDQKNGRVLAVGQEALAMAGRLGERASIHQPLQQGKIYDLDLARALLKVYLQRVLKSSYFFRPVMMASVPAESTDARRQTVVELLHSVGAREVYTISQPLAAAIGAGTPIADTSGSFIVQMGSGVVEAAIISLGSLVHWQSTIAAGSKADAAIQTLLRDQHSLTISLEIAERLKKTIGSIDAQVEKEQLTTGQDVLESSPKELRISSNMIRPPLVELAQQYEALLKQLLSKIPPELTVDVIDKGILLSGGWSKLGGFDQYLVSKLGLPVSVVEDPSHATIKGIATALEHLDQFKESLGYQL